MRACSSSFLTIASASSRRRRAPASSPASNRYAAATSARRTDPSTSSTGVNFRASPDSSAADCGAPRAAAAAATSSSTSATTSSGPCVARARCRALSSRSSTVAASLSWVSRRRVEEADVYTADANNGCVNRIPSRRAKRALSRSLASAFPRCPAPRRMQQRGAPRLGALRPPSSGVSGAWARAVPISGRRGGRGGRQEEEGSPPHPADRSGRAPVRSSRAKNGFPLAAS